MNSTKEKQIYLRKNIIEKGYEPVKFTEYLSTQKENGNDIDTWTMPELQAVVQKYIEHTPKPADPTPKLQLPSEAEDSQDDEDSKDIKSVTEKNSALGEKLVSSLTTASPTSNL